MSTVIRPAKNPGADERELRQKRLELSQKRPWLAAAIFALPLAAYVVAFIAILALPSIFAIALAVLLGWLIGVLFIIGHDACHQSYTSSRRLNDVVGRIAFLPSLHNFSLWDLGHNRIHHRYNNVRRSDYVWEPMNRAEYEAAPLLRRLGYRFTRTPLGVPFYYAFAIWFPKMFTVRRSVFGEFKPAYLWDAFLVWGFLAVECGLALWIGQHFGKGPLESIASAVLVPFLIWNVLMSFVIYLHHTHPDVPWYASVDDWRDANGQLTGTVHVHFPWLIRKMTLDIMEHNAHHFAPGVPLYNLQRMQSELATERIVTWRWSISEFFRVCRACKLFDYDERRWIPFG